jgi:CMP-N-acetylneuraminic acid synthetase
MHRTAPGNAADGAAPLPQRVLGLVPARGGSKGVRRKNVRLLGGKPLLEHTADAALGAARLHRVILSTDDDEIAAIGRRAGLDVPFMRPAELAQDDTPMLPVVQHALATMTRLGERFDAVCLLQPTNPLRSASLIDQCITTFASTVCSAVVTVLPIPLAYNPHWAFVTAEDGSLRLFSGEREPVGRRQSLPPAFHREGSVYVTDAEVLRAGSLYGDRVMGVVVDPSRSVNIDDESDWVRAEQLLDIVHA